MALRFYADSALSQPLDSTQVVFDREIGGDPVDRAFYLGNPDSNLRYEADDGSGLITVGVTDSDPGSGWSATDIRLALSEAGLDSATPGEAVEITGPIQGGLSGAKPVWVRFEGTSPTPLTADDLGLTTNVWREYQS